MHTVGSIAVLVTPFPPRVAEPVAAAARARLRDLRARRLRDPAARQLLDPARREHRAARRAAVR